MRAALFNFCLLTFLSVVAAGKELYLMSNKNEVPGYNTFYKIDQPDQGKSKAEALSTNQFDANNNYLSQACICNGIYYAIWDDIAVNAWGITGIRLTNETKNSMDTFELSTTPHFFHSLACGPNKNELIGIGNIPGADIRFNLISLDISDPDNTVETILYDGFDNTQGNLWDTQFTYISDLKEMWAIESTIYNKIVKNKLYRVPVTKNAEPKIYNVDYSDIVQFKGLPVFTYFVTNMGSSTGGLMASLKNTDDQDFYLSNFEFDDKTMSIKIQRKDLVLRTELHSGGVSIPVDSDGKLYFTNQNSQTIFAVDGKSQSFDTLNSFTFTQSGLPYKAIGGLQVV